MRRSQRTCVLLIVLLLALGCGKGYKLAPVSGRVTLDQHPLANAEVRFVPTAGQDLPYSIDVTDEGTPGAVVGPHHVTISMNQARAKIVPRAGTRGAPKLGELLPSKYNRNSTLSCDVPPEGKNYANFDLTSK
jgi:hypothetical protein